MAAEEWALKLVREELERASDVNEGRSREQLQALGIGAGDLEGVLDALLADGSVTEEAPGQYRHLSEELREPRAAAAAEEEPEPDEPEVEPEAPEPERSSEEQAAALDELLSPEEQRATLLRLAGQMAGDLGERELILSRPMIQAMDPAQLGAMLLAAINAEEHRVVVLRVEP